MPFLFVLPSAARPNIVSRKRSNWSAGRTSQRKRAVSSPALRKLCFVPAGTVTTSPGPATTFSRPRRNSSVPVRTSKRSDWYGWTCGGGDGAVGLDADLDLDELAVGLGGRAQERDALARDGVRRSCRLRGWMSGTCSLESVSLARVDVARTLREGGARLPRGELDSWGRETGVWTVRLAARPAARRRYIRSGASTPTRSRLRAITAFVAVTSARRKPCASLSSTRWWW